MSFKRIFIALIIVCLSHSTVQARPLAIACAANFTQPMKELIKMYEEKSDTKVRCTFGSTGMLYGQITQGAPYDIFFAADEKRPDLLFKAGYSTPPQLYAKGQLALWTAEKYPKSITDWKEAVVADQTKHIGIANPDTAPYGLAAFKAMDTVNLHSKLKSKCVFGKSVGIAFQYGYSKAADVAFVALSQALSDKGKKGTYWLVTEAPLVRQSSCIINSGELRKAADFMEWFNTEEAHAVVVKYGYK